MVSTSCKKKAIDWPYTALTSFTDDAINAVINIDETLIAVGGKRYNHGWYAYSQDQGVTWTQSENISPNSLYALACSSLESCYLSGGSSKLYRLSITNQAITKFQLPGMKELGWTYLQSVDLWPNSKYTAVGGQGYFRGVFFKNENGNYSWDSTSVNHELRDIQTVNDSVAYACGYGVAYKTMDQGLSWNLLDVRGDFFKALYFIDTETGFMVGDDGTIHKTTDGGTSWERLRKQNKLNTRQYHFNDVYFSSNQNGIIVGQNIVLITNDGGNNWDIIKNLDSENFMSFTPINTEIGLLVGQNGGIWQVQMP